MKSLLKKLSATAAVVIGMSSALAALKTGSAQLFSAEFPVSITWPSVKVDKSFAIIDSTWRLSGGNARIYGKVLVGSTALSYQGGNLIVNMYSPDGHTMVPLSFNGTTIKAKEGTYSLSPGPCKLAVTAQGDPSKPSGYYQLVATCPTSSAKQ